MAKGRKPDFNLVMPIDIGDGDKKRTRYVRFGSLWKLDGKEGYSGDVDFWPAGGPTRVLILPVKDTQAAGDGGELADEEIPY